MKITVFGGAGFLGSHVSDKLSDAGHDPGAGFSESGRVHRPLVRAARCHRAGSTGATLSGQGCAHAARVVRARFSSARGLPRIPRPGHALGDVASSHGELGH